MILIKYIKAHKQILVLCVTFIFTCSFYFWYRSWDNTSDDNFYDGPFSKFLIYNNMCQIPDIDPWHYEAQAIYEQVHFKPKNIELLVRMKRVERDIFLVTEKNVPGYPNLNCLSCDVIPGNGTVPDSFIRKKNCQAFTNFIQMRNPVVEVKCSSWSVPVFRDIFANYIGYDIPNGPPENSSKHFNVMIIGIDSISRLGFLRLLPKTNHILLDKGWIRYEAYNKVGENTLPNIMAILAGSNTNYGNNIYFDDEPFIWKEFKKMGYLTSFAETEKTTNTFNVNKYGFRTAPTDFYFRPYTIAMEELYKQVLKDMNYMTGGRLTEGRLLDLALELPLASNKFFGYFWLSTFSHDNPNVPQLVDDRLVEFLKQLERRNTLKNTIIFFLADHGFRMGSVRLSTRGWYEDRLPFMYIYVPESFRETYPEQYKNLRANSKKLVSGYDLYVTLQDVLVLSKFNYTIKKPIGCYRCSSFFKVMPEKRSCGNAGILDQFCTCLVYRTLSKTGPLPYQLATAIIDKLNEIVDRDKTAKIKCRIFHFQKIINAAVANSTSTVGANHVKLIVQVRPSATFEGHFTGSPVSGGVNYKMLEYPFRLDAYGKTSWCMQKVHVKRFCYCVFRQ